MNLNKEKLTCCLVLLYFVYGIYTVGTRFTRQGKAAPLPNITIRRAESNVFAPEQKPYLSAVEGATFGVAGRC